MMDHNILTNALKGALVYEANPTRPGGLLEALGETLRVRDRQTAVNKLTWFNLPPEISPDIIGRVLYTRFKGCLFLSEFDGRFRFLPYTLHAWDGQGIDEYGRFTGAQPLPFNGEKDTEGGAFTPRKLIYEPLTEEEAAPNMYRYAVPLFDHTAGEPYDSTPTSSLTAPVIRLQTAILPAMRTSLLSATGVAAFHAEAADEVGAVRDLNDNITRAQVEGFKLVPMRRSDEFVPLDTGGGRPSAEYLQAFQALENLRLTIHGVENGGVFEKASHLLQDESNLNKGGTGIALEDSLRQAQRFCTVANSLWGTRIWCEPSESLAGADMNGDGLKGSDEEMGGHGGDILS